MTSEEQDSDDGEYRSIEDAQYRVIYTHTKNSKELEFCEKENIIKKRCSAGRSAYNPGRLKRVVSCKRKTHHLNVSRRKQPSTGRTHDVASKKNEIACVQDEMEEIFYMDPWEFPPTVPDTSETEERVSKDSDYFIELSKDHSRMMEVLFGRNLRLTVALTLWQRNVGELLTYFLRIQDSGVFVDFLPMIIKRNVQVFKQQLKEFWDQEPYLISVPGSAGEIAKVIDSCLLKLP
ncbi:KATNB1-like protein 1 isoform X2 [Esox lucius]|uniref:KATNB1-like protein 1 isoform X2 n=1 Tax=Esox lucius TaxID=8010 RepID=UPI001476FCC0|nr:KATNB1-like protein 1 isoform X2 [Esox lucius]